MEKNLINPKVKRLKINVSTIAIFVGLVFLFAGNGSALNLADNFPMFLAAIIFGSITFVFTGRYKIVVFDKYLFWFLIIMFFASLFMGLISPYADSGTTKTMVMFPILILIVLIIKESDADVKVIEYGVVLSSCIFSYLLLFHGDYYLSMYTGKYTYIQSFGNHIVFEPNYLSLFITLGFEISIVLLVDNISRKSSFIFKILLSAMSVFQMIAMFRTGSRMSLVAVIIFSLVYIAFMKNKTLKRRLFAVVGIMIVFLIFSIESGLIPDTMIERLFHASYKDGSNLKRISDWSYGIKAIFENPIGYGPSITSNIIERLFGFRGDAHNTFITFGVYYGLVGFIAFIALWIYCALKLLKQKDYGWFAVLISMVFQANILATQCTISLWIFLLISMMKIKISNMNYLVKREEVV